MGIRSLAMPPIETMIDELAAAGWKPKVGNTIWQDPNGCLFAGPAGAWRVMKQRIET